MGNNTFERHAAGCLEHDQLVSGQAGRKQRAQRRGIGGGQQAVAQRLDVGRQGRDELPDHRQELRAEIHQQLRDLGVQCGAGRTELPHGAGDEDQRAASRASPRAVAIAARNEAGLAL